MWNTYDNEADPDMLPIMVASIDINGMDAAEVTN